MKALEVKFLNKYYGEFQAVNNVNFSIEEKEIFALVGPNGAGKSTILKLIATILSYSDGEISVYGKNIRDNEEEVRGMISYLPEDAGAYKNLSGTEYLKFMAAMYTDSSKQQKEFVEFGSQLCGLGSRMKDKVKTYSKGMTRKLLLARAVMSRPKLAILDEPTSGLDVINAHEIRKIIKDLAREGMSALLSSHNMLEVEYLADRVAIIDKGEIKVTGTPDELKQKYSARNLEEVFVEIA